MVIPEFMWLLNRFIEEYGIVKFEAIYTYYIIYYILRDTFYHGNEYHVSNSTTPML